MLRTTRAYFGDGVYGEYDGYHIVLTANGVGTEATDRIFLEPGMADRIAEWTHRSHIDYNTGLKFGEEPHTQGETS